MSSPLTDPGTYDVIEFDGVTSPGVVKLSGFEREQNLDVKESDGQKGATTTWKGTKCGKGTATFYLIDDSATGDDDFALWDEFAKHLLSTIPPASGKKPQAKDIWHPDLERNGYHSVILEKMGKLEHDGKGGATVAVDLAEYFPPKKVSTGNSGGSKTKEDPNDPLVQARKELDDLLGDGKKP